MSLNMHGLLLVNLSLHGRVACLRRMLLDSQSEMGDARAADKAASPPLEPPVVRPVW